LGVIEDVLYCGAKFLTPQTEKYMQNYYEELLGSINLSAEKYGILKTTVNFYYTYPEHGANQIHDDSLISPINKNDDTTTTPHTVACLRPLIQCTTDSNIEGPKGCRFSICVYSKSSGVHYVITCGHGDVRDMTVYQSGLEIKDGKITTRENMDSDRIGEVEVSFDPLKRDRNKGIKTDASLTKLEPEHYENPEKKLCLSHIMTQLVPIIQCILNTLKQ
jgi:hypothetical protein